MSMVTIRSTIQEREEEKTRRINIYIYLSTEEEGSDYMTVHKVKKVDRLELETLNNYILEGYLGPEWILLVNTGLKLSRG